VISALADFEKSNDEYQSSPALCAAARMGKNLNREVHASLRFVFASAVKLKFPTGVARLKRLSNMLGHAQRLS
jgi:hypothetical protein